ncbi:glycosyltransferase family 4 protein [Candidatus Uhrbacteria bacterium]|nr:glycosyltransferase family 4 protein [Candidatus Uhrbacteria bacterium]
MTHTPRISMAVFFTHDVSLERWEQRGMLSRELAFYQTLAQTGMDVCLYTYGKNDGRYRNRLGPNLTLAEKTCHCPASHYAFMLPFVYWKQLHKADLFRIHQVAGAIPALLAHWLWRKPLIVRAGFQWYRFAKKQGASRLKLWLISFIERLAYRSATSIIHTTQEDADFVAQRYHISKTKIHIIPNYVDTDLFKPLPIQKQPRSICHVGRLEKQKNLGMLIEALQGLDAPLTIYGEGSLQRTLEEQARSFDVVVEFRGRIANEKLPREFNACEIFILPSLYEGHPKVLLEAMACGLAVIGTRVEGIKDIIRDGENGVLCGTDVPSIHAALARLLEDSSTRLELGTAARETILQHASLLQAIRMEVGLLQHLVL